MADETTLETRVTDAAAACAEEIAADEGWHDDSDLTLLKLVIARYMRELIGVAGAAQSPGESPAAEADRLRQVLARTNDKICQTLAQALGGYHWYKDDQVNFPGTTEANGVIIVEQTAEDLAELAAKRISELRARITALDAITPLLSDFQAACVSAGRFGDEEYRDDVRRLRAKLNAILCSEPAQEQTANATC